MEGITSMENGRGGKVKERSNPEKEEEVGPTVPGLVCQGKKIQRTSDGEIRKRERFVDLIEL